MSTMNNDLNRAQQASWVKIRDALCANLMGHPADQVYLRIASLERDVDSQHLVLQVEARVENPDTGWSTDWYWVDGFGLNRNGTKF